MRDPSTDYRTALAHELRPLTRRIAQALAERVEPEGRAAYPFEVEQLAEGLPGELLPALETLSSALPGLLGERSWLPPGEAAREAVVDVESAVDSLLEVLRSVRERAFPYGQEDGQQVLSAYAERPLKVVLAALAWLVGTIEDDDDATCEVSLDLTPEAEAVNAWLGRQGWRGGSQGCSWTGLAAAFLLGHWVGGE